MKIYLSGPMTNHKDHNFPKFDEVARELRERHYKVVSPAELDRDIVPGTKPWEWYLKRDIKAMFECDTVVLLPGWQDSRGAKLETLVAHHLAMHIFELDEEYNLVPSKMGNQDMTVL